MKGRRFFVILGVIAAAGAAIGMLSERKRPAKGGIMGAAAGVVAGSTAAGVYEYVVRRNIPYYSSSSPLYEDDAF